MATVDEMLSWLKAGNSLTPLEALEQFRCLSLSQRMGDLRRAGWPVQSELIRLPSGKRCARYYLVAA